MAIRTAAQTIPAGYDLPGATAFKIASGHRAGYVVFVTPTGQPVRFPPS